MYDAIDHDGLYRLAEAQAGYFTAQQALTTGMDRSTLRHHARPGGRYKRVRRGLYRLRHFPSSPHEHIVSTWLSLHQTPAVVSHESALELYDLSDVIPNAVHISLPRTKRGQRPRPGVRVHTLQHPPALSEIRPLDGVPVTTPEAHNRGFAAGRNPARADRTRGTPGARARAHDTPAAARLRRRASCPRAESHRTRSCWRPRVRYGDGGAFRRFCSKVDTLG